MHAGLGAMSGSIDAGEILLGQVGGAAFGVEAHARGATIVRKWPNQRA